MYYHHMMYWHPYWHPFWHPFGMFGFMGHTMLIGVAIWAAIYFLPTIIARSRDVASGGGLFWVNLLFGWTMIGWVLCLFWAILGQTRAQLAYRGYAGYPPPPPPWRRGWW
ncbi:MAG TPA: superinfection immunity protein [Acetobacteraceae bacterium]|jgi:hypothetical protein|nr:superinfection immunity protein [Acetobacteraceae bacterium]